MAKKLLGERQLGDKVYNAGQILSDEEFAASGLQESDVTAVNEAPTPVEAEETAVAPVDGDADVDAQNSASDVEKKEEQESAPNGSETEVSTTGGEGGTAPTEVAETVETVEHTLTEQDLIDNPDLVAQGHKAGDVVRVPKEEASQ